MNIEYFLNESLQSWFRSRFVRDNLKPVGRRNFQYVHDDIAQDSSLLLHVASAIVFALRGSVLFYLVSYSGAGAQLHWFLFARVAAQFKSCEH